ncbi:nuclear transport factor 2 family protein [Micromonospora rosaria]|nr:nuclear transport factor 2 family protein [Micromonospora rosaria]
MSYTAVEERNLDIVRTALRGAASDFTRFFDEIFADDVEWTIAGHGPVARTYQGMKDLYDNAEAALYQRLAEPLAVTPHGSWADGDEVIVRIRSASRAIDGEPYRNEYLYVLTMADGKVVSGIEWLDLHAYYGIVERVHR